MDEKFFVPFDTAQQLKEEGYPQEFADWYYHDTADEFAFVHSRYVPERVVKGQLTELGVLYTAAPTYHEVLDWLYGKKICITCHPAYSYEGQYNGFRYEMQTYDEDDYPDDVYRTREEALNEAIIAALEML